MPYPYDDPHLHGESSHEDKKVVNLRESFEVATGAEQKFSGILRLFTYR